jgi:ankyrin repeat protein/SAM-dependent methyltransferase
VFVSTSVLNNSSTQPLWVDWNDRPEDLKSNIHDSYEKLRPCSVSGWGYFNGSEGYCLCGVDEKALLKKIILDGYPKQKEFYVLDIGAGNFQLSQAIADFIEKETDLPKDIKVHIIGVRGESYWGERVVETDRCKIYNMGAFKVEEIFAKFKEQGLDLENKVDIAISRWCFRHLNDPVGTFQQVYNLLRPRTGYFLLDGFFFLRNQERMDDQFNKSMTQLLLDTKAPFLAQYHNDMHSLNRFILRRPDEIPCRIPMTYIETCGIGGDWQVGSQHVTRFKREPQDHDEVRLYYDSKIVSGEKALYEWLKQSGVLDSPGLIWKPVHAKDDQRIQPPLHKVVLCNAIHELEEMITQGEDMNASDAEGCTPLHLAVRNRSFEVFQLLLKKGAMTNLYNEKKYTPLHEAVIVDTEGQFLQALIDVGAKVDAKAWLGTTPLHLALEAKNLKAIEILIKNGTQISEDDDRTLQGPDFSSLREQGIIASWGKVSGLQDVQEMIDNGDCVVLHFFGCKKIMYHSPNTHNTDPRLIYVDVKEVSLLNENGWPALLKLASYESVPDVEEKITGFKKENIKKYHYPHLIFPQLHLAVMEGKQDMVKELLDQGASVNQRGDYGNCGDRTLHIAVKKVSTDEKSFEILLTLLKKGADPDLFNQNGETALHLAIFAEPRVMEALIEAGADVNAKAEGKPSVLTCAIAAKNQSAVKMLIKNGAKISKQNEQDLKEAGY